MSDVHISFLWNKKKSTNIILRVFYKSSFLDEGKILYNYDVFVTSFAATLFPK